MLVGLLLTAVLFLGPPLAQAKGLGVKPANPLMKTSYACQGRTLNLSCDNGYVIKVVRANYGRFSVAICNDAGRTDWSVNCMAPRSLRIMQERCNLRSECNILSSSDQFGVDPCPGTPKYLEVNYGCYLESTTTTTSSAAPLPPWMTTKSTLSFFPAMIDLDITPPPPRVPITVGQADTTDAAADDTTAAPPSAESAASTSTARPSPESATHPAAAGDGEVQQTDRRPVDDATDSPASTAEEKSQAPTSSTTLRPDAEKAVVQKSTTKKDDTSKFLYAAESGANETVKIVLSTLPPKLPFFHGVDEPEGGSDNSPLPTDGVSPQTNLRHPVGEQCQPRKIRALSWGWTRAGTAAVMPCPEGTAGVARWECAPANDGNSVAQWATPSPDLSQCQSFWMKKIHEELKKTDSVVNIANDLVQYVAANPLYGGDIMAAINAIAIIAEKMHFQLGSIPTQEQKEAVVMEIVQSVIKTGSILLADHMLPAWQDLQQPLQRKFLSLFLKALENTGTLLPKAVTNDQEASISSQNILLSVKKISFKNIIKTHFPSRAARATRDWQDYHDTVEIPALVLMENMNNDASEIVFFSFKNLEHLLVPSDVRHTVKVGEAGGGGELSKTTHRIVNSRVLYTSLGNSRQRMIFSEPISILFEHRTVENVTNPRCVHWDFARNTWSPERCELVFSNSSHSECSCNHLSSFALVDEVEPVDSLSRLTFLVIIIITVTVSVITLLSLVLVIIYCRKVKVQDDWKERLARSSLPCFQRKNESVSYSSNFYAGSPTFLARSYDSSLNVADSIIPKNDFMILSQAVNDDRGECEAGPQAPSYNRKLHTTELRRVPAVLHPYSGVHAAAYATQPHDPHHHHQMAYQSSQPCSGSHIYMEVDPIYTGILRHSETQSELMSSDPSEEDLVATTGVVSSNSSQASSGYSTAPSQAGLNLSRGTASILRAAYSQEASSHGSPGPTKDATVFSISQNLPEAGMARRYSLTRDRGGVKRGANSRRSHNSQAADHPLIRLEESQMI